MDSNLNKFGARLRGLIASHKLTNEEVIKRLHISRATLFNWFNRDNPPPSKAHQDRLVALFNEPREYILFGRVESKPKSRLVPSAGEAPGGYEASPIEHLKNNIRTQLEATLVAANDDLGRLGWLLEELRSLQPSHWEDEGEGQLSRDHERAVRAVLAEERRKKRSA